MTGLEAATELAKYDHAILSPEGATKFWTAMGLDGENVPLHEIEHDPLSFKGANLDGCSVPGEKRMGVGADALAEYACRALEVEYPSMMGRGFRLRACCDALKRHFGE